MENLDDYAKHATGADPADMPPTDFDVYGRIIWAGMAWAVLISFCLFWLRDAVPDPFDWWIWGGLVVPVVAVPCALLLVWLVKRWPGKH